MRITHRLSRFTVIHPFLFTLFPILSLLSRNLGQVPITAVFRAIVVGLLACGGLLVLLRIAMKDWHRAGLATTLAAILFFSFGPVYHLLRQSNLLVLVWGAIFLLGVWWIVRRVRGVPARATRVLNLTGWIALASCLYGFVIYGVQLMQVGGVLHAQAAPNVPSLQPVPSSVPSRIADDTTPDIYYIILDGHARSDVLSEIYGVDNSRFINFLKKRGFYVASQSHSNYGQTALSLSSSLNFNYLEARMELLPESSDRGPLVNLINDNDVRRFLKKAGYRTVAFNNGFPVTEMVQADEFIQESDGLNNFEISLLLDSLGGQELTEPILDSYRQRILGTEEKLKSLVNDPEAGPEPKFVFAHFILPHPPFVFQADGSPRLSLDSGDGSHYSGLPEDYWAGYREQVQYADRMAEEIITYILEHSQREPIIIIQGDHGSGYHLDWESQENSCLRERFSILNAYYLPGKKKVNLYSSITPVNSFRVVFNAYFKANLPMLPDRSYYSTWDQPYDLHEVTGKWEQTCAR